MLQGHSRPQQVLLFEKSASEPRQTRGRPVPGTKATQPVAALPDTPSSAADRADPRALPQRPALGNDVARRLPPLCNEVSARCRQMGVYPEEAALWFEFGLLNFNPRRHDWERSMLLGLAFVRDVVRAHSSLWHVRKMLSGLGRPYAYHHDRIFYDFHARRWRQRLDSDAILGDCGADPDRAVEGIRVLLRALVRAGCREHLQTVRQVLIETIAGDQDDSDG